MIKNKLRSGIGVSLISLSITVTIILIITSTLIYNLKDNLKIEKLRKLQNDISNLSEKVASYYSRNGAIPKASEYIYKENLENSGILGAMDTGNFYIIDLSAIENLTLNYGKDYEKWKLDNSINVSTLSDIYIINENSHNIFYVQGISVDNETFYTNYTKDDVDKAKVNSANREQLWTPKYDVNGIYKDKNENKVTVPEGFQVSLAEGQNTVEDGLVITDGTNSYVWIEVPISVTESSNNDSEIETALQTYATDYRTTYTDEWYDGSGKTASTSTNLDDTTGCGLTNSQYNELKSKMLNSIKNNGGFWIGQYEMGTDTARISKTDPLTTPVCKEGAYPYNYVTCSQAQERASTLSTGNYTSSLMFGIQWDLVCKFLDGKDGLTTADINSNSGSWGNYADSTITNLSGKYAIYSQSTWSLGDWAEISGDYTKPNSGTENWVLLSTGSSEYTNRMNIYDFAGNVFEWTLEKSSDSGDPCSCRGGIYGNNGSDYPASSRDNYTASFSYSYIGFRPTLY